MLIPNQIPDKEPGIRVGIILPEDKKQTLSIEGPKAAAYELSGKDNGMPFRFSGPLRFEFQGKNKIKTVHGSSPVWTIKPLTDISLHARCGLKIYGVPAGRGFHWQKPIDVYLSGVVEISVFQQYLLVINELPLEEYLMCVATSEMSAACPPALIESQTITARSWMLANIEQKHISLGMDVCNDDCCQRYQGNNNLTEQSIAGASETRGEVLLYQGQICDARYSKNCGGMMETFPTIWNGSDHAYLLNKPDAPAAYPDLNLPLTDEKNVRAWIDTVPSAFCSPHLVPQSTLKNYLGNVDEAGAYFRWQFSYSQAELTALLHEKLKQNIGSVSSLNPLERGGSGRIVRLEIRYLSTDGREKATRIESEYMIRKVLHADFLYSSCFYVHTQPAASVKPERFHLHGAGWGHGVGYCQIGALGMALASYSTKEILAHYYPGSELKKIY